MAWSRSWRHLDGLGWDLTRPPSGNHPRPSRQVRRVANDFYAERHKPFTNPSLGPKAKAKRSSNEEAWAALLP